MTEPETRDTPASRLGRIFRSLGARLFLLLFGVMVVVFAAYAWVNVRTASRQFTDQTNRAAWRASELIKQSTFYGMLLNRKEDVHQIIRQVAELPGVLGVRIYDKRGTIIYSAREEEIGERVDQEAEACVICHDRAEPLQSVPAQGRTRVYRGPEGHRVLGLINPIQNEPRCSNAACHAHPPGQTVLGVLDVKMSLEDVDERLGDMTRATILATLLMALLIGGASALFIHRVVRVPVGRLMQGTRRIAHGDLATEVRVGTRDELGDLAEAFNRMTADLRLAREEIHDWSERLEQKVVEKTDELGRAQRQIVHMEKMASLGKLAATVAHELNNPLAGILTYARLVARGLDEGNLTDEERREAIRYLAMIQKESGRCGDIVKNLLVFARKSGAEFALHPLNQILDRAVMIVRHHLEMAGVTLEFRPVEGDDGLVCDADQIQQALVALLVNAVEAMPGGGTLTLAAEADHGEARVTVADTGVGISEDALPSIFEPFFTTKETGTGTGLGLAVVYGIVQRHAGRIEVESKVGTGTIFRVRLPRKPPSRSGGAGSEGAGRGVT